MSPYSPGSRSTPEYISTVVIEVYYVYNKYTSPIWVPPLVAYYTLDWSQELYRELFQCVLVCLNMSECVSVGVCVCA